MIDKETINKLIEFSSSPDDIFLYEGKEISSEYGIVPIDATEDLPEYQAIYFVITDDDEILYIGRAKNLFERWRTGHHKSVKFFEKGIPFIIYAIFHELSRSEMSFLERYYIKKHKPTLQG